jgi:hypothetical protein
VPLRWSLLPQAASSYTFHPIGQGLPSNVQILGCLSLIPIQVFECAEQDPFSNSSKLIASSGSSSVALATPGFACRISSGQCFGMVYFGILDT